MDVYAIVLAAGESQRFGANKLLHPWGKRPLVGVALDTAVSVCGERTVLVVGNDCSAVLEAAAPQAGFVVSNERFARGIGTSIAVAVRAVRHVANAILLTLADQPLVEAGHLQALIDAWSGDNDEIIASAYADTIGPPVLLPRATFDDLSVLDGDRGARELLTDPRFRVQSLPCEAAALDIDTPADVEQRSQFTQPESPST
ncbi:MAG: nucleotidyltransferase family protein [Woeseiaceae bacterium]|nr:nucleotidyltransferase family protein [Woeseiaceae bacterium]